MKKYLKIVKSYITLARPKCWLKNILVFVPIIYAKHFTDLELWLSTFYCFFAFCMVSSAVYTVNDIFDIKRDQNHPIKCKRPIASGQIGIKKAIVFALLLIFFGIVLTFLCQNTFLVIGIIILYILLNLIYSFVFKHIAILDCFCIAAGFLLRTFAGGVTSGDKISKWLFLSITTISLFLAFGKRRGEIIHTSDFKKTREVLKNYNFKFLNGIVFVFSGLSIVFYALWSIESTPYMIYTVPLAIFIICKYLLIIYCKPSHGDPTSVILESKTLTVTLEIFGIISIMLLYFQI